MILVCNDLIYTLDRLQELLIASEPQEMDLLIVIDT